MPSAHAWMHEHAGAREIGPCTQLAGVRAEHDDDLGQPGRAKGLQRTLDERAAPDVGEQLAAPAGGAEARARTRGEQDARDVHANRPNRRLAQGWLETAPSQTSSAMPRPRTGASLNAWPDPPVATNRRSWPGTRSATGLPSGVKS